MAYDPHQGMSTAMLEHFLSVTRKNGYHCVFPYGWKLQLPYELIRDDLRAPFFIGWTIRAFFYIITETKKSHTHVRLGLPNVEPHVYYKIHVADGTDVTANGYTTANKSFMEQNSAKFNQGDYISLGIQFYRQLNIFKGFLNNNSLRPVDMGDIKDGTAWEYHISPSYNTLTSIHVYDDLGTNFPDIGLGSEYRVSPVPLFVGSYGIFELIYGRGGGDLTIAFDEGGSQRSHHYASTNLIPGSQFTVYIRKTPTGWLVHPSFQKTADLVQRHKNTNLISPIFTPASIFKMYLEAARQP